MTDAVNQAEAENTATGNEDAGNEGGNQQIADLDLSAIEGGNNQQTAKEGEQAAQDENAGEGDPQPKPWELDYNGETVVVPEAFRNEDGTPNAAAMARSIDDLRRKMGTGEFNDSVPEDGESYEFAVPEDLADDIELADPEMAAAIEGVMRELSVGKKLGQQVFAKVAGIMGKKVMEGAQANQEAMQNFRTDQIASVGKYAKEDDLQAWGGHVGNMLVADLHGGKLPGKTEAEQNEYAATIGRGLRDINGSAEAILAMRYLMTSVGGEGAIPSLDGKGDGSGEGLAALQEETTKLMNSKEYWKDGDPTVTARVKANFEKMANMR